MRDSGIVVNRTICGEAQLFVKSERVGLRPQLGACDARLHAQHVKRRPDQRRAQARAARPGQHADAADLARVAVQQDAGAADRLVFVSGQQVDGAAVQVVDLSILGNTLLLDEHGAAQGKAGGKVVGLFDLHSKYFSRIRW